MAATDGAVELVQLDIDSDLDGSSPDDLPINNKTPKFVDFRWDF